MIMAISAPRQESFEWERSPYAGVRPNTNQFFVNKRRRFRIKGYLNGKSFWKRILVLLRAIFDKTN